MADGERNWRERSFQLFNRLTEMCWVGNKLKTEKRNTNRFSFTRISCKTFLNCWILKCLNAHIWIDFKPEKNFLWWNHHRWKRLLCATYVSKTFTMFVLSARNVQILMYAGRSVQTMKDITSISILTLQLLSAFIKQTKNTSIIFFYESLWGNPDRTVTGQTIKSPILLNNWSFWMEFNIFSLIKTKYQSNVS